MSNIPSSGLQLRSIITSGGQLELSLAEVPVAARNRMPQSLAAGERRVPFHANSVPIKVRKVVEGSSVISQTGLTR